MSTKDILPNDSLLKRKKYLDYMGCSNSSASHVAVEGMFPVDATPTMIDHENVLNLAAKIRKGFNPSFEYKFQFNEFKKKFSDKHVKLPHTLVMEPLVVETGCQTVDVDEENVHRVKMKTNEDEAAFNAKFTQSVQTEEQQPHPSATKSTMTDDVTSENIPTVQPRSSEKIRNSRLSFCFDSPPKKFSSILKEKSELVNEISTFLQQDVDILASSRSLSLGVDD